MYLKENVVDSCRESTVNISGVENAGVCEVTDIGWLSSLEKLLRVPGYVVRFVRNLKKVLNKSESGDRGLLIQEIEIIVGEM